MEPSSHKPVLALAAITSLVCIVPVAQADYAFGTMVSKGDFDFQPYPNAKPLGLCLYEPDVDGVWDEERDALYLDQDASGTQYCQGGPTKDDIRIKSAFSQFAVGSQVGFTDPEITEVLKFSTPTATIDGGNSLAHKVRYLDAELDGSFKAADTMYLDLVNLADKVVNPGDVRLTKFGPYAVGSIVKVGDQDAARPIREFGGSERSFGSSNAVYKAASGFYFNVDAGAVPSSTMTAAAAPSWELFAEEFDVRLNAKSINPLSEKSAYQMTDVRVDPQVTAGRPFQVTGVIKNTGKWPGSGLMATEVDGLLVDSRGSPTLLPGESVELVITVFAPHEAGSFKLNVGGTTVFVTAIAAPGTTVSSMASEVAPKVTQALTPQAVNQQGAAGASLPLLVIGVLAAALTALRRRLD